MHKPPLRNLVVLQFSFCLALGAAFGLGSATAASSALLGSLAIALANAWYLWRLYRAELGGDSAKVLGAYYRAEVGKVLLLAVLLAVVLRLVPVLDNRALFGSFLLASVFITLSNSWALGRWLARNE